MAKPGFCTVTLDPSPRLTHCSCHCPEERFWGLGEEGEDVARCFCPPPMAGARPLGSPVCCAPCAGAGGGGRVLPAAVVMPRSRQVYSSPVQNTCCFMVPGRGRVPAGRVVEAPAREAAGCPCPAVGCGCQLWACAPWACLPKPVQSTSAWPRCE